MVTEAGIAFIEGIINYNICFTIAFFHKASEIMDIILTITKAPVAVVNQLIGADKKCETKLW